MTTAPDPAPLTDEELAAFYKRYAGTDRVLYAEPQYGAVTTMADARRLLAEVDRLRAELETVADEAGNQCREAAARTVRAEKERDALAAKLHAVDAVLNAHAEGKDPMGLCMEMGSPAMRIAGMIATARAENTALAARLAESEARRKDLFRRLGEAHDDLGDALAENTALAGKVREFLDDERAIARRLSEVDDQNEKMRLLGLCKARKTMREYLGDDAPTRRSCGAKAQFFADDLLYTIGCGKDHGHRDPHYSFTAERGWVDGGVPFRAALGETADANGGES